MQPYGDWGITAIIERGMHKLNAVRKIGDAILRDFGLYGGRSGKSG